jgi:2-iminobutanoate/2-iminopropanoate deaminase
MARREVLEIPGLGHGTNPIPLGVKIGSMVFSSTIMGQDTTGETPNEPDQQIALAFQNMRRLVELAGGTTDDIAKVVVYLKDLRLRELVNVEWVKMFPNAHDRPVRHTIQSDSPTNPGIQLEIIAVL